MKRRISTAVHTRQEYVPFILTLIYQKHTTCSGFIAKLSTTRSRRHWSQHPSTRTAPGQSYVCMHICVLIPLYMRPYTICVLIPLYIFVLILLYVSSYHYIFVLILLYVSSYHYICVLIMLYVSSYYFIRVCILLYVPHTVCVCTCVRACVAALVLLC